MEPNADFEVFGCFRVFLVPFRVIFSTIRVALDSLWAWGGLIRSFMVIYGHIPFFYAKENYLFTQRLFLKNQLCVGYPPLGEDFVEKWVADEKK